MKPSKYTIYLIGIVAACGLLPLPLDIWLWLVALVGGVAAADIALHVFGYRSPNITVERGVPSSIAVHRETVVRLKIRNHSGRGIFTKIFDTCPAELNPQIAFEFIPIGSSHQVSLSYRINPTQRGTFQISFVTLVVRSILHLWEFKVTFPTSSTVRIYPDFAAITAFLELAAQQYTTQVGVKLVARRGTGLEFEQLREYRQGDPINHIDWKATASHQKLITREFQDERDQSITVLLDSGMTMQMKDGELATFDHALNALILVSYVALRQGDSVAVQFFGNSDRWVAPVKGVTEINTLLNSVFDVQTGPVPSDYISVAETLISRQRKRSLVLLITNARGKSMDIPDALRLLSARHLTVLVNLRDSFVDQLPEREVSSYDDAILVAEHADYVRERRHLHRHCAQSCHLTVDCRPTELLVSLLNAYWQIKRSGSL